MRNKIIVSVCLMFALSTGLVHADTTVQAANAQTANLSIVTKSPMAGTVGVLYSVLFQVQGSSYSPYTWELTSGSYPAGLELKSPKGVTECMTQSYPPSYCPSSFTNTAVVLLSGKPQEAGTYKFTLKVTDSWSNSTAQNFTMTFTEGGGTTTGLSMTADNALQGRIGQPFKTTFTSSGGTPPFTFTVKSGSIPAGLLWGSPERGTFNCISAPCLYPETQTILSGTPSESGNFTFTLEAKDYNGSTVQQSFAVTINNSDVLTPGPGGACAKTPGTLVKDSAGTVYLVSEQGAYAFTSAKDFQVKGFAWSDIDCTNGDAVKELPKQTQFSWPIGISFKYKNAPAVYYLTKEKCKALYGSMPTLRTWLKDLREIKVIPEDAKFPDCGLVQLPDNSLVQGAHSTVYATKGKTIQPFTSADAFKRRGFSFGNILKVSPEELKQYTVGDPLN